MKSSPRRYVSATNGQTLTRKERRSAFMRSRDEQQPAFAPASPLPYTPVRSRYERSDDERESGCRTMNGARSNDSSGDPLVNLYFRLVPGIEAADAAPLIEAAAAASLLDLLRLAFDVRNCRGGKGRRQLFYLIGSHLLYGGDARRARAWLHNVQHVPHYGYYKDLWALLENAPAAALRATADVRAALEQRVVDVFAAQLAADCLSVWGMTPADYQRAADTGGRPTPVDASTGAAASLAAKYAPTCGKHADCALGAATLLRQRLGLSERSYRWMVADLRGVVDVVEKKMSAGQWTDIDLARVPSVALLRSRDALARHAPDAWEAFKQRVRAGTDSVNVGQLQPYELINVLMQRDDDDVELLLSEYVRKHGVAMSRVAVVADTSGSMHSRDAPRPIDVCMALTLLAAENAVGDMAGRYFAFSDRSELVQLEGNSYRQKLLRAQEGPWGMNTNVQAVFEQVLLKIQAGADIRTVMVISDMQFDACGRDATNFDEIDRRFRAAGVKRPVFVFWNVSSLGRDCPVKADEHGTVLVSGCSPSLFQMIVDAPDNISPAAFVRSVLDQQAYARIQLPPESD